MKKSVFGTNIICSLNNAVIQSESIWTKFSCAMTLTFMSHLFNSRVILTLNWFEYWYLIKTKNKTQKKGFVDVTQLDFHNMNWGMFINRHFIVLTAPLIFPNSYSVHIHYRLWVVRMYVWINQKRIGACRENRMVFDTLVIKMRITLAMEIRRSFFFISRRWVVAVSRWKIHVDFGNAIADAAYSLLQIMPIFTLAFWKGCVIWIHFSHLTGILS